MNLSLILIKGVVLRVFTFVNTHEIVPFQYLQFMIHGVHLNKTASTYVRQQCKERFKNEIAAVQVCPESGAEVSPSLDRWTTKLVPCFMVLEVLLLLPESLRGGNQREGVSQRCDAIPVTCRSGGDPGS